MSFKVIFPWNLFICTILHKCYMSYKCWRFPKNFREKCIPPCFDLKCESPDKIRTFNRIKYFFISKQMSIFVTKTVFILIIKDFPFLKWAQLNHNKDFKCNFLHANCQYQKYWNSFSLKYQCHHLSLMTKNLYSFEVRNGISNDSSS